MLGVGEEMTYDLDKIRAACLELMGWHYATDGSPHTIGPKGERISWAAIEAQTANPPLPNPARYLDDAQPLMEKYLIDLSSRRAPTGEMRCYASPASVVVDGPDVNADDPSAPLAVCLAALLRGGRGLKEFET